MQISEMMSTTLEFVSPAVPVCEAAVLMGELDVGALPVGSPGDLVGIITDRDILLRVAAEGRDPTQTKVRDAMSSTLFICRDSDSLAAVMDMMASYHVRRMPVADTNGTIVGWVTLTDIARQLLQDSGCIRNALRELTDAPG